MRNLNIRNITQYTLYVVAGLVTLAILISLLTPRVSSQDDDLTSDAYVNEAYNTLRQRKQSEQELIAHKERVQAQINELQTKIDYTNKLLEDNLIYMKSAKVAVCQYKQHNTNVFDDIDCSNVTLSASFR